MIFVAVVLNLIIASGFANQTLDRGQRGGGGDGAGKRGAGKSRVTACRVMVHPPRDPHTTWRRLRAHADSALALAHRVGHFHPRGKALRHTTERGRCASQTRRATLFEYCALGRIVLQGLGPKPPHRAGLLVQHVARAPRRLREPRAAIKPERAATRERQGERVTCVRESSVQRRARMCATRDAGTCVWRREEATIPRDTTSNDARLRIGHERARARCGGREGPRQRVDTGGHAAEHVGEPRRRPIALVACARTALGRALAAAARARRRAGGGRRLVAVVVRLGVWRRVLDEEDLDAKAVSRARYSRWTRDDDKILFLNRASSLELNRRTHQQS